MTHGAMVKRARHSFSSPVRPHSRTFHQKISPRRASRPKSGTRTVTRSKRRNPQIHGGVGGSNSTFKTALKGKTDSRVVKKVLDEVPTQVYEYNQSFVNINSRNKQAAQAIDYVNYPDLDYIRTQIAAPLSQSTSGTEGAFMTFQHFHAVETELLLTNATNFNSRVKIYDLMARHDTIRSFTPLLAWTSGYTSAGAGAIDYQSIPGSTPFQSYPFCQEFRVKKVTDIILPGGSVHIHKGHIRMNKKVPAAFEQNQSANGIGQAGGWTHWVMIVSHGFPNSDSAANNDAVIGVVKIDCVFTIKYKFRMLQSAQQARNVYTNNLPALVGNEQGVTEEGDVVATEVSA